jgi:hypothetical protein
MDTLLCNDDGDVIFFGAPSATDEVLAFHYGDFDNHYGDGTVEAAAANGRVYADTVPATLPSKFGSIGTPSTASGQTTYSWTPPPTTMNANVLVVAGGGGVPGDVGGGGGAGGLLLSTDIDISNTTHTIKVGSGGSGSLFGIANDSSSTNGNNSSISTLGMEAIGGGRGALYDSHVGGTGGSGGGASRNRGPGAGTTGQGYSGGTITTYSPHASSGGGGAGGPGGNMYNTTIGSDGGIGILVSVYGETYGQSGWFAGGGGGGGSGGGGKGGLGGGGDGKDRDTIFPGYDGTPHTGGGGGGNAHGHRGGANGGSGVVLVRYIADTAVLTNEETLAFLYAGSGTETETTYTWDAEGVTYADILVVGGGGGGATAPSIFTPHGGGGGGEVVYRRGVPVTPGVEIKVGRGGPIATQGGISQFTAAIQANGGGRGGSGSGGSGGGARRGVQTGGASVKLSVDGMGNVGGYTTNAGAGGGGGATEPGAIGSSTNGTNGGEGYTANVFGVWNTVYGSGGGGGARIGGGGRGGTNAGNGGNHSATPIYGGVGVVNTGSGGGGGGAGGTRGSGAPGGSGIVLVKPNPGALDGLGSSVYTQAVGAYALRRLFGAYTGAQVRLRRSTDNAETDVYFDKYGYPVNFDVETWLGGATGYVVTWYDQGPNATHTTGYGTTLPSIYHRGGGTYAVYFPGTSATAGGYFNAGSVTLNIATNGGVSTFSRVNFLGANSYERVYDYGNNLRDDNLLLFRSGTSNNLVFEMYEGIGTDRSSITVSNGILNNTWQSFGNRIQGSGSSWIFSTRIDGTENTSAISRTYTDRTITRSYIGRSNWSDSYSNMYLACQIFFNTGSITSEQFGVMENVLY